MKKELHLSLPPEYAHDKDAIRDFLVRKEGWSPDSLSLIIRRKSIDARQKKIKVNIDAEAYVDEAPPAMIRYTKPHKSVQDSGEVIIIGSGPAGLFAALRLIEFGLKPVIIERGKDVRSRRRDLAAINKDHIVNPDSNYCFGEGGAGTYSDGKLYTRSKKRGDVQRILEILYAHGAREEILSDAHPHIGTNKLPKLIAEMRQTIIEAGGEIHFEKRVTDLILENKRIKGVITSDGDKWASKAVLLATGHSARDIFEMLYRKNVKIEFKPFALGVRVEHPQSLIDSIQYHCDSRGPYLPAAAYSLVHQVKHDQAQHGVFSFCMCPGGFIVPSATEPGEIVVNGMSPSRRDSRFANSGIVVSVGEEDVRQFTDKGALKGMYFQKMVEQKAFELGGSSQAAPAQRMVDFVQNKVSNQLNATSYQPGLQPVSMHDVLPDFISQSLKQAFKAFGKKMKGYFTNEAQLIGIESRTSSPVRIPRNRETLEHIEIEGLYPCGEGAGYAGGIVSAAMDGERCAEQIAKKLNKNPV